VGELFHRLRLIGEDLKTSWYFRIWGFLWCVTLLLTFQALISLSLRSSEAERNKSLVFWIENATELEFPRFRIAFHEDEVGQTFTSAPFCEHGKGPLLITLPCDKTLDRSKCFVVSTDGQYVQNTPEARRGASRITCTFNTTATNTTGRNVVLSWNFENATSPSIFFEPRASPGAWILLKKIEIGTTGVSHWEKELVYHSMVSTPGSYVVSAVIDSFRVEHFDIEDTYNGFMAVGEIGGFGFFMVFLHTFLMILLGFCFDNNSKFLGAMPTTEESKPIVQ